MVSGKQGWGEGDPASLQTFGWKLYRGVKTWRRKNYTEVSKCGKILQRFQKAKNIYRGMKKS